MGAILGLRSLLGHETILGLAQPGTAAGSVVTLVARPRTFTLTVLPRPAGGFNLASAATVFPNPVQQLVAETITWPINCAAIVPPGQSITSATSTLYDTTVPGTRTSVSTPTCTPVGAVVNAALPTGTMVAGHTYSLIVLCVISSTLHVAVEVDIVTPY